VQNEPEKLSIEDRCFLLYGVDYEALARRSHYELRSCVGELGRSYADSVAHNCWLEMCISMARGEKLPAVANVIRAPN